MLKDSIGKKEMCDGCGWSKQIHWVDEYGKGFCEECLRIHQLKDNRKLQMKGLK